jgi:SurA-like protein
VRGQRWLVLSLGAALAVAASGCGSGSHTARSTKPAAGGTPPHVAALRGGDVAVVGREHITKAEVDALIDEFRAVNASEHRPFPGRGTAGYKEYQDDAVDYFVRGAVFEQQARARLGIVISDAQVERSIAQIRDHTFGGSEARMMKHFEGLGIDRRQLVRFQRLQLAEDRLPSILATRAHLHVSGAEARAYYKQHLRHFAGQTFAQAKPAAVAAVRQGKTNVLVRGWVARIVRTACGEIRYQAGYHPANLVCEAT